MRTLYLAFAIILLTLLSSCDERKQSAGLNVASNSPPSTVTPPAPPSPTQQYFNVVHTGTVISGYGVAPLWFVKLDLQLLSSVHTHVVVETLYTNSVTGITYGTVRAFRIEAGKMVADYAVLYDGSAPSGRIGSAYPATISGDNEYNGVSWLDEHPWNYQIQRWHLDLSLEHVHLHPKAGHIISSDLSAKIDFSVDVSPNSNVSVRIF